MDFFLGWVLFDFLSWGGLGGSQGCPLVAGPPLIYIISLLHLPLNFTSPQSVKIPTVCGALKHWTTIIVVQLLNIGSWSTITIAQFSSAQFRFKVKSWSSHSLPADHWFKLSYRNFRFQEKTQMSIFLLLLPQLPWNVFQLVRQNQFPDTVQCPMSRVVFKVHFGSFNFPPPQITLAPLLRGKF